MHVSKLCTVVHDRLCILHNVCYTLEVNQSDKSVAFLLFASNEVKGSYVTGCSLPLGQR